MSQLPSSWRETPIETVTEVVSGGTPSSKHPEYYTEDHKGSIAWVTPADLSGYKEKYISHGRRSITKSGYDSCSAKLMPKGTVLFSSRAPIGYTVIAANEISTNQGFKSFVPVVGVNETYLYYYLRSIKHLAESLATGTTFKELSGKVAKTLPFPLAPFAEQTRIVEKLDEVLAQVDTIKARLDGIPAILKRFRQSVLAAAVSGKLTEEWRGNHPALDSTHEVANIIESRKAIVAKRMQVPQEHLKNEEYPIPDSWIWTSLDALSSKIVDGVHHKPEYVDEGIPFMSVKDINGGKLSFDNCKYISQVTHEEIHPRCNPCRGDLLITKSGTIGRTAIIKTDDIFDLFVSVALIKPASSLVNMEFINIALMHWVNSIDVSSRVVGTAIKNLHLRDMRVLAVPFAPLEEQKEIVRLVDQYFAFADTIEAQVKKAQARVDKLTQSILAKAFRGELVPQDPNDEPADKLLERIAAARKEAEVLAKVAKKAAQK
ncbi:restriction endonuclease subunit S [Vibrio cholerae]|uniref:restriction endonuclease subunit S n=1 Tax=Vibrio cholerae TaxID=666 RepID=UPI000DBE03F3|nr:restriction endonuclease subunit S [Vibrio cholerae]EGR2122587.1 type I restriction endonuclease subunit S [Vibrio cholerae]EJL6538142.1 restriction endonuclease subunit S [Vibrio cholerae]ELF3150193.1 restriction endonuclease subunit S [Vibrio cholerae]ELH5113784.1 restriction endonuclease subunit S [Vibrio cholerae]MCD6656728.1 restriction endonuclease subunit S [Vibrio cholerae]